MFNNSPNSERESLVESKAVLLKATDTSWVCNSQPIVVPSQKLNSVKV